MANPPVKCDLGDVLDLSVSGMRVACPSKPPIRVGQTVNLRVGGASGQSVPVSALVKWVRRKGLKTYQVGIQFVNLKSSTRVILQSLAQYGFVDLEMLRRKTGTDVARGSAGVQPAARVDLPDYYSILGVQPDATDDEIRVAYRVAARDSHPDTSADPEAAERFKRIGEAYQVLKDASSRRSYDQRRAG